MFPSFIRRVRVCVRAARRKVPHLTYNLHGKGSVLLGGNDEAGGTLANTIPSGEGENNASERGREGKAKKICLGRGKKKEEKERAVLLCPIVEAHCWRIATCPRRQKKKSCDSIREMTSVRRRYVLERQLQNPLIGLQPDFVLSKK